MQTLWGPVKSVLNIEVSYFRGALIHNEASLLKCPEYRGILISGVLNTYIEASLLKCPEYRGILFQGCFNT